MTKTNFQQFIRENFSDKTNCLVIDKIQYITKDQHGNNSFCICEIITYFDNQRNIIQFIGFDHEENIAKNIKIEVISLTLKSPSHPNLSGSYQVKHSIVYHGSMTDSENPNELNCKFLLNILQNLNSFIKN